jgi:hypothetical protein
MSQDEKVAEARHPEWPAEYQNWMTIIEATEALGLSNSGYTRTLLKPAKPGAEAKLQGQLLTAANGRTRWAVDPASIAHYKATRGTFGARKTTFRRYLLRIDTRLSNEDEVRDTLKEAIGAEAFTLEPAYKGAPKKKSVPKDAKWAVAVVDSLIPAEEEVIDADDDGMDL